MSSSSSAVPGQWWKRLRHMSIPTKVKIFWWRTIHNFLPAKKELKRGHIAYESHCEDCGHPEESMYHVALECTFARRFWEAIKLLTCKKLPALHPLAWAIDLLAGDVCPAENAYLFICGIWSLWTGRNNRRHGKERWSADATAKHVAGMVEDVLLIQLGTKCTGVPRPVQWKTPERGNAKINTDGAFDHHTSMGSSGVVIRDEYDRGAVQVVQSISGMALSRML